MDLKEFRAIHNAIGSPTRTETDRLEAIHRVSQDFDRSLSVDTFYLWDRELTDTEVHLNIFNRKYSTVIGQQEEFTCLRNTPIRTGDIVYNPVEDFYFIVMDCRDKDYIYKGGLLYRCNYNFKWRDNKGKIWEYPVHTSNATQYNSGISLGMNVNFATSQYKVNIPADENTINLRLDKRIFFGRNKELPEVYYITQIDTTSNNYDKGIVCLTLLRGQYNEDTDDIELWLCDEKQRDPISNSDIAMTYSGTATIRIGGQKTVTATGYRITSWEITDSTLAPYITIEKISEERCKLKVMSNTALVNSSFYLKCIDTNGNTGLQQFTIVGGV